METPTPRVMLITAFEPSGDALGARLVEAMRAESTTGPWRFVGLGGPRMEAAGVELLEETVGHASMGVGLGLVGEAKLLLSRVRLVKRWLLDHRVDVHVPIDAPAANWSFCKRVRALKPDAKVVHLVAPQVWAWASWRVGRLRRWSDRVLCLLPFEPDWFAGRGVDGRFVGHPLFERPGAVGAAAGAGAGAGAGEGGAEVAKGRPGAANGPRLALLPGSRTAEVEKNWPDMLAAFDTLRHRHPGLSVRVAAADAARADLIRRLSPGGRLPRRMEMVTGDASAVLDWADAALIVSGTATLEAASRGTPMVAVYRTSERAWKTLGRLLIRARTFALPNLLAEHLSVVDAEGGERLVPELIPHFGGHEPLVRALTPLLIDDAARARQRVGFERIGDAYAAVSFREAVVANVDDVVAKHESAA